MDDDVLQQAGALIRHQRGERMNALSLPPNDEAEDDLPLLLDEVEEIIELQPAVLPPVRSGIIEALVEQRLAELLPNRVDREFKVRLQNAVDAQVALDLPGRVEREVEARLGEAVEARLAALLPGRVQAEVDARLEGAVNARLAEELPQKVRETIVAQLGADTPENLPEGVSDAIDAAVEARLVQRLPEAVEAALPDRVAGEVEARLNAMQLQLKEGLQARLTHWLNTHLPGIVEQELAQAAQAVAQRAEAQAQASLAADLDAWIAQARGSAPR